ncbi:MAG: TIGR04255 family protein [Paludibacteraceae bacterium]|nr:TIGR04255 family protein [Paludibacteraceae bacterium]
MQYQILQNPPVAVALVQLKFRIPNFKVESVLEYDNLLKHHLPIRHNNIQVGIDLGKSAFPLGESKISGTSNAEVGSYIYFSKNQKTKLEISHDTLTYIDENPYDGWDNFKDRVKQMFNILSPLFVSAEISRTSIRFINRFTLDNFDDPGSYFNALITSSNGSSFPLRQYGFRLMMDVPDSDMCAVVNHNVENVQDKYLYTFDIDVLDYQKLIYAFDSISEILETLRGVKNKIFFDTLTEKTIELCNSHR